MKNQNNRGGNSFSWIVFDKGKIVNVNTHEYSIMK